MSADTNFIPERISSASILGQDLIEHEFDALKEPFRESEPFLLRKEGNIPVGECFLKFVEWVKNYTYYHALVCVCDNAKELENQLDLDFDELYNNCK